MQNKKVIRTIAGFMAVSFLTEPILHTLHPEKEPSDKIAIIKPDKMFPSHEHTEEHHSTRHVGETIIAVSSSSSSILSASNWTATSS